MSSDGLGDVEIAVDESDVVQRDGYINPFRNSILRFKDSDIGNGSAADMTFYAGDFGASTG